MTNDQMKTLLEDIVLKVMGQGLDYGRMSIDNDRQYKQFERSLRVVTRQLLSEGHRLIDENSDDCPSSSQ